MKKHNFKNQEGLNLVGVLHEPIAKTDRIVIIVHGRTSNKDRGRHIKLADFLAENDISAFRIDLAGSGESDDREITIQGQLGDLVSTINFVKDMGYQKIGLVGESLGGLLALMTSDKSIKTMVLWAPVTKGKDQMSSFSSEQRRDIEEQGYFIREKDGRKFKIGKEYVLEKANLDREGLLARVGVPVLIVHGSKDEMVPLEDSKEAVKMLPKGSRLEIIDGWEHGDIKMEKKMNIIVPVTVSWFKDKLE